MQTPKPPKAPELARIKKPDVPRFKVPEFGLPDIKLPDPGADFYDCLREFLQRWWEQVPEGYTMSVTCSCVHSEPIEVLRFGRAGDFMFVEGVNCEEEPAAVLTHFAQLQFSVRNVKIAPDQEKRPRIGFVG